MAAKVLGNTTGIKASHLKRLNNFYRRRMPTSELILAEQARDLSRLSFEIGRQLGLVISRKGEVMQVVVGEPEFLPLPHMGRLRRGRTRLAGYHLLHTRLNAKGLNRGDANLLANRRLDFVASLEVNSEGLAGDIFLAHILPEPQGGSDYRLLAPFRAGYPPEDISRLVWSLEQELNRGSEAMDVDQSGNAVLVSVTTKPKRIAQESLDELSELAKSAGLLVKGKIIQTRSKLNPRTIIGPGKLDEVLVYCLRQGADVIIFDQELNPSQAHSLARHTNSEIKFLDRTQLILDIFAQRALTREGKLQVEMAQLRYLGPRLGARDDGLSRLTGGIGGRGPGETKLEIDRRRVRTRLNRLENELKKVARQRKNRRSRRKKMGLPIISIVGYTNAGKSTLLNVLTGSKVLSQDRLFATLDPTTRRLRFPEEQEVIITDTVGFIRDLPKDLKKAFAATLEELHQADLLLHLADASHPQIDKQIKAVQGILNELDLIETPALLVLNKKDLTPPDVVERLSNQYPSAAFISALDTNTLPEMLKTLHGMVKGLIY